MTDRPFSASAIELAKCPRAWGLRYLDGLKKPELTWEQCLEYDAHRNAPVLPPGVVRPEGGQRGAAAGKVVHLYAEWYLTGADHEHEDDHAFIGPVRRIDWSSFPGQVLESMRDHLPPAGSIPREDVERPIEIEVHGVRFIGYVDVVVAASRQIWDHKTSRDIREYAKLPHDVALSIEQPERSLRDDLQAAIYTTWLNETHGCGPSTVHWTYAETDKSRRSLPVVQEMNFGRALTVVMGAAMLARELLTYETSADAPANTMQCDAFGGCWYGREGHCTEMRDYGAILVALEQKKAGDKKMPKLSFKELQSRVAGAAPAAVEAPAKAEPLTSPESVAAVKSATKAFRARKAAIVEVVAEQEPEAETPVPDIDEDGAGTLPPPNEGTTLAYAIGYVRAMLPAGCTVSITAKDS